MSDLNITEARRTFGALLRLPYEALQARVYGGLAARGFPEIRPAHSSVFRHIAAGGSRLTDLAARAGMTKQSMAYLVESLERGGFLSTVPDPADGRAKLVLLTTSGRRVWNALIALSGEAEADLAEQMGRERFALLRTLLEEASATSSGEAGPASGTPESNVAAGRRAR
jgi:DNA-binding MarR family transcriptional regulator